MKRVYLSHSLQESNRGVGSYGTELHRTREIARAAAKYLKQAGVATKLPEPAWCYLPEGVPMQRAVGVSNRWGADLHICIHTNAGGKGADGTMTFYMPGSGSGHKIAAYIQKHVAPLSPGSDYGLLTSPVFYETRAANAPVAYLEAAFHTDNADALSVIAHHDRYGRAIAEACLDYFGMPYPWAQKDKAPTPKPTPKPKRKPKKRSLWRIVDRWFGA